MNTSTDPNSPATLADAPAVTQTTTYPRCPDCNSILMPEQFCAACGYETTLRKARKSDATPAKAAHTASKLDVRFLESVAPEIHSATEKVATIELNIPDEDDGDAYRQRCRNYAHLFAAAPDLLAALESMIEWEMKIRQGDNWNPAVVEDEAEWKAARAAIAKAKGAQ